MKKTVIIDADSLIYFTMGHDVVSDAQADLVNRIKEICTETAATHFVLYLTPEKTFRHDLARTKPYKGNRRPEEDKVPMFFALKQYITATLGAVTVDNLEADDMVGLHVAKIRASGDEDFALASIDKDVLGQIPGRNWNYQKTEWHQTSDEDAAKFLWTQTLMGDSGDNIQGIPRMGPKTAEKVLAGGDFPAATVNAYIEKFGPAMGVEMFTEMFRLVSVLQDEKVAARFAKVVYAEPADVATLPVLVSKADQSGFTDLTSGEADSESPVKSMTADDL